MRNRQHVNPLALAFETYHGPTLHFKEPVEVEIGCADAQFLFERAAKQPGHQYVGLEIREQLVHEVNLQAESLNLPVRALLCNASLHLRQIFGRQGVDRVYLNFPDPWFKKRHHKRRMINRKLLEQLAIVTKFDAEIFFQSDVWDVALETMALFEERSDFFANQAGSWSFWKEGNAYGAKSWREVNAEINSLPVWRLMYRRKTTIV